MDAKAKLIEKAEKILGKDSTNELMSLPNEKLEALIVSSTREVEDAKAELDANPNYIQIKEDKKLLESGLREVKKLNNVRVQLAASLLTERGK